MVMKRDRKIVLEDGTEYIGTGFGSRNDAVCEIVFNTSMVGYQEIISDPACTDQAVVMTYPLIGNYGITDEDFETKTPTVGAVIVREYNDSPSNFRYTKTLSEIMEENRIPGICGVDTRKLTRTIRDNGTMKVLITDADTDHEKAMEILRTTELPADSVARVSCRKRWYSRTPNPKYNVVAVDCGITLSTVRALNQRRCNVTVVPWNTSVEAVEQMKPDGIFLSGGPGNPADVASVAELVKALRGKYPMFGISLGCEIIGLAYGAKTCKLKFGHRGGNHPIRETATGLVEISAQNHSYAIDGATVEGTGLTVTHENVLDGSVEGVECAAERVFGVQFLPNDAIGPESSIRLFDKFVALMKEGNANA
ncbi:MAG: glutamine-hydrolyzing carbamoyl-phosphate synthase small subunit [Clostridia bacterium]|nr:glutamine-hydrolyzing carbamoyl-phosphate synthase small subunit [Clostridia bacterium]